MDHVYYIDKNNSFTKLTETRDQINFMNTIMYKLYKSKDNIDKFLYLTNLIQEYKQNIKISIYNKDKKWYIIQLNSRLDTIINIFNNTFNTNNVTFYNYTY
jgi:hypothetical protein